MSLELYSVSISSGSDVVPLFDKRSAKPRKGKLRTPALVHAKTSHCEKIVETEYILSRYVTYIYTVWSRNFSPRYCIYLSLKKKQYLFIYLFIYNIRHEALARPNIGKQ